ncbi:hypothetical protein SAMN05421676_104276 [Salinibacillus kushneri]|uniref:TIGR01777 family protein n=1 Tax=Salinibacillus kushneri TaxID=237682 RepID=A0A1I0E3J2_9BACI|nr:TIGR01777 family oxidoreductase [Salinibacillus kushneri]SET39319.1 hypothetical protein SAMN05421676_104276 [Salinibacillus kushneri]
MNVLIAGGTGFIGHHLVQSMIQQEHHIYILTRSYGKREKSPFLHYITWFTQDEHTLPNLPQIDVIINLAGEPINKGRWTSNKKKKIYESRKQTTRKMIRIMKELETKPKVFINASAIGIYGYSYHKEFTEESDSLQNGFPARVCRMWEQEASQAEQLGIRTVIARLGIVLGDDGGALPRMMMPYHLFAGGKVASGEQWVSWIHMNDLVRLFHYIIQQETIKGPINITAPHPVQMNELGKRIGQALRRPHWFPAPAWMLKMVFGEMSEFLTEGQKVVPKKALMYGFEYRYSTCKQALQQILATKEG